MINLSDPSYQPIKGAVEGEVGMTSTVIKVGEILLKSSKLHGQTPGLVFR
jgi:hypothetical protein